MGFVKALIGLPIIFVVLVFALNNNDMVEFDFWPTGFKAIISLSVAIVVLIALGYILGWFFTWLSYTPLRRSLRQQKRQNKKLSKEQEKLVKTVEGLNGDIENLKASVPAELKPSWKNKIKNLFIHKKDKVKDKENV